MGSSEATKNNMTEMSTDRSVIPLYLKQPQSTTIVGCSILFTKRETLQIVLNFFALSMIKNTL
jgi:hypothetical protein